MLRLADKSKQSPYQTLLGVGCRREGQGSGGSKVKSSTEEMKLVMAGEDEGKDGKGGGEGECEGWERVMGAC